MIMKVKKVKLAFLEDKKARNATSKRRTKAVLKKLGELVELCNVKACLVFFLRPSREGTEELCYKFMDLSLRNQTEKMVNQTIITKPDKEDGEESLWKKGESSASSSASSPFPPPPLVYQPWYTQRRQGESSSPSLPRRPDVFETWYNNKMQSERLYEYHAQRPYAFNMTHNLNQNMNLNQSLTLNQNQNLKYGLTLTQNQYLTLIPNQNLTPNPNQNQNQNEKEPFKFNYQALYDFYDSIPEMLDAFNKKYNLNVNHNLVPYDKYTDLEANPSLNENQGFMDASEELMDESGDDRNTPFMDGSSSAQPIIID